MDRTVSPDNPKTARTGLAVISVIALILLIVGGLNWALVGLFNIDLVATLFGTMSILSRIVYVLVGVAAIYALSLLPRLSRSPV
jgi:uncharacterized protein